jgi:hypothetical protein
MKKLADLLSLTIQMLDSGFSPPNTAGSVGLPLQPNPLLHKLCPSDQLEYVQLVNHLAYSDERNRRNLGMSTFLKHLTLIHDFVCRGDGSDALRGLICGIEFGHKSFLINTRQLKILMFRSKSCMNGCFQRLGYAVCRPNRDFAAIFAEILPGYGVHCSTPRQWCVRTATDAVTWSLSPNIQFEFAGPIIEQTPAVTESQPAQKKPASTFMFAIEELLNPPTQCDIHRMFAQLPPLRS